MKPSRFIAFALLAISACLAGCDGKPVKSAVGETDPADAGGITFKPKEGLSVPDDIARHIGLKLDDVMKRKVNDQLSFTAQVYAEAEAQAQCVILASAWVDSTLAKSLRSGTDIVATTGGHSITGVVTRVLLAANTNSLAEVLIELRAEQSELKIGDFARVTVATTGREAVMAVPRAAVLHTTEGDFIYILNGKHIIRAAVKVGGAQDGFVEIKSGLLAGDKIAVAGVAMLRLAELHHTNGGDACCVPR